MADNITNEVASMAHELTELRANVDSYRRTIAMQEQELDMLRSEAVNLRARTLRADDRSTAMFTIMEQVSAGLISGIRRMGAMDAENKRRQQADALGVGGSDASPVYQPKPAAPLAAPQGPAMFFVRLNGARPGVNDQPLAVRGDQITDLDTENRWELNDDLGKALDWWLVGGLVRVDPAAKTNVDPVSGPARPPQGSAGRDGPPEAMIAHSGPTLPQRLTREQIIELASRPVPQRGVRTDIVDSRLPPVTPNDNADASALARMHAIIGERQQS
jgi:hypothetical protein